MGVDEGKSTVKTKKVEMENMKELGKKPAEEVRKNIKKVGAGRSKELEREMKEGDTVDTTPTSYCDAEPGAGPQVEVSKSTMKKCCFILENFCSHLENEYEFETSSVGTEKLNLVPADALHITRSSRG